MVFLFTPLIRTVSVYHSSRQTDVLVFKGRLGNSRARRVGESKAHRSKVKWSGKGTESQLRETSLRKEDS